MKKLSAFVGILLMMTALSGHMLPVHAYYDKSVIFGEIDRTVNEGEPIRGVDVSSVLSLEESGVKFYNDQNQEADIFQILSDHGVNYIRVRVWNQPSDKNGHSYGGGHNDVKTAAEIGRRAAKYGMKLLVDFHYSDFWADPEKQRTPKAWQNYSADEKGTAIYYYTLESLKTIREAGALIGMVQIGNETNGVMCGENDMYTICKLFKAGCNAVQDFDPAVLKVLHFADPSSGKYSWYAKILNECEVNYDVFATSYYPYWHGTTENMTSVLKQIADDYDKYVMVAETAYPYTDDDGDKFANVVSSGSENSVFRYEISIDGQAECLTDVFQAVANVGKKGIGAFYWEPAWIGLDTSYGEQVNHWETYGSGWSTSYAVDYDPSVTKAGGSSYDNQALFNFWGYPLDSLDVFQHVYPQKYVYHAEDQYTPVSGMYTIKNRNSGLYLSADAQGNIIQSDTPSEWHLSRQGDVYTLMWNDDAMTISESDDGKNKIRLGSQAQPFYLIDNHNNTCCFIYKNQFCLDIFDQSTEVGAWVTYSKTLRTENQQFMLECISEDLRGDTDQDQEINLKDVILLHKYLMKHENLTRKQFSQSDMNQDGKVNIYDWILLKKQLFRK